MTKATSLTAEGIIAYYVANSELTESKLKALLNFQEISTNESKADLKSLLYVYAIAYTLGKYGKDNLTFVTSDEHAPTEAQVYSYLNDHWDYLLNCVVTEEKQEFVPESVTIH